LRYPLGRVACRSVLPRERFSPLARNGNAAMSDLSPLCEQKRTSTICDKTLHFPRLTTATGYKPAFAPLRRSDPAAEGHHDHTPSGNSHSEKRQCSLATCTTTFAVQLSLLSPLITVPGAAQRAACDFTHPLAVHTKPWRTDWPRSARKTNPESRQGQGSDVAARCLLLSRALRDSLPD